MAPTRRGSLLQNLQVPDDLPIADHADEIIANLRDHQVLIVCGETGSGKSTQLPKLCVAAGYGEFGRIGHTQPRRLAARSIAARLAEETGTRLGREIGYQVRFGDQTSDATIIKLMTDGILLAETGSDPDLRAYDVIIIDEAHERSLNIDFLLGYLRRLIDRRPELRVIITSATIDAARFADHFGRHHDDGRMDPAPVLMVEGRGYPVEIRYLPWTDVDADATDHYSLSRHVIAAIDSVRRDGSGDTLVFLPTERDIREISHQVAREFQRLGMSGRTECLPLYARLPASQQQAIFHPTGKRQRFIFATNVAESSLTVPGIRCVIDTGTARMSRYSPRTKLQRLPVESISQASANQRAGRCGRVGPGTCVRLYSADDFAERPAFTTPEIRRTNLASVLLQSKTLRLGPLEDFPLLDVPRRESIREGIRTLDELGAIDDREELTEIGWRLGRMPVDPRVGRILIEAASRHVLPEVLPIAAAMEIQDPRDRPPDQRQAADEAHAEFLDPESDFLSNLRLWRWYEQTRSEKSRNQLTKQLRRRYLSPARMREWSEVYRQLRELASTLSNNGASTRQGRRKLGTIRYCDEGPAHPNAPAPIVDVDRYAAIHQSLLSGLLSGVAMSGNKNEYVGARDLKLFLWPGSGVFEAKPKWIVAAELVETAKQYARIVAKIQPAWIESVAAHLLKPSYRDPHWSRKSGGAFVYQRLSLFGLPVVSHRRVPLPPIDMATSRDLLIQHGLVEGELTTTARSIRHNRSLVASIERLGAKTRRRDLVVDDYTLAAFYQSRIPDWVADRARLEKYDRSQIPPDWVQGLHDDAGVASWLAVPFDVPDDATLFLTPDDLVTTGGEPIGADAFPDELAAGASRLPLSYQFAPGTDEDGVRVTIHQSALSQLSDDRLGWLVPGLLHGKVLAMIKSLPKRLRRNLVPAADVTTRVVEEISPLRDQAPFMKTLCEALTRHAETPITPTDFQADKLESHTQFLVRVVDDDGRTVTSDRGIERLKQTVRSVADEPPPSTDETDANWSRSSMKQWDLDELPTEVLRERGGVMVAQYPGLVDEGEAVATRLFSDSASAQAANRLGCTRLFSIACRKDLRAQVRHLPSLSESKMKLAPVIPSSALESSMADLIARIAFVESEPPIRTRSQFESLLDQAGTRIGVATQDVAKWLSSWTDRYHAMRLQWDELRGSGVENARQDVMRQLEWLLADGFVSWTPWSWLQHYPRYFHAITYRLDKVQGGAASRDKASSQLITDLLQRWLQTMPSESVQPRQLAPNDFRWMIEELRVSEFAQPLGTSMKISATRCSKWLDQRSGTLNSGTMG
ncbi:MAG: ATP-dependent RNA helicase HrpA [Planctomycetota bacterium]